MKILRIAILLIVASILAFATIKKVSPVSWGLWGNTNTAAGVALRGYDPVSYFNGETPLPGDSGISFEWNDAIWFFDSEENKRRFAQNPILFAPEFGGFCAFAVSKGFTADVNPHAWHIKDDRLYVFMDQDVRDDWVAQIGNGSLVSSYENWATRHEQ